jgi:glutathione S-transferase
VIELYFSPGACSFVPHVGLEAIKAATGEDFKPNLVMLHLGENMTPEYVALNPNGQVPVLVVDGKPLSQIVAICDYLDRRFPQAGLLPTETWAHTQALSQLAWFNNTVHTAFTRWFRTGYFAQGEAAQADVKQLAVSDLRRHFERIQEWSRSAAPFWFGNRPGFHDAYAFTLLRWGGYAGIDPDSFPAYRAYVDRVVQSPPVAAALDRERIKLDTYKKAA